jgi:hypothetical protein
LQITAPDAPEIVARREAELHPPPPPPPPPPAWTLVRSAPQGALPDVAAVYQAVNAYRDAVLPGDARSKRCLPLAARSAAVRRRVARSSG